MTARLCLFSFPVVTESVTKCSLAFKCCANSGIVCVVVICKLSFCVWYTTVNGTFSLSSKFYSHLKFHEAKFKQFSCHIHFTVDINCIMNGCAGKPALVNLLMALETSYFHGFVFASVESGLLHTWEKLENDLSFRNVKLKARNKTTV